MKPVSTLALCVIEFLERLAFYTFLSVFVLFLTGERGMADAVAFDLYGWLMFGLYVAPVVGGLLADAGLGPRRATSLGAALLALGYGGLALQPQALLYPALIALTLGSGLFKPSVLALVATGAPGGEPRRDAAFIWFFVAITVGAGLGPLLSGLQATPPSYQLVFVGSALAQLMALALSLFLLRPLAAAPPLAAPPPPPPSAVGTEHLGLVLRILLIAALACCARGAVHTQLLLWSRDHADLSFGGRLPASLGSGLLQASEALFQLVLSPLLVLALVLLRRRGLVPTSAAKIGMAMVLQVLPCLLLFRAALAGSESQPASWTWLLGANLLSALPNLFLLPLVLSVVARLSPATRQATVFGLWFPIQSLLSAVAGKASLALHRLPATANFGVATLIAALAVVLWIAHTRRIDRALSSAPATH